MTTQWSNADWWGVCALFGIALGLSIMYHVHSLQEHKDVAYIAYRTMIGCHEVDALSTIGRMPPEMRQPDRATIARCTGASAGYDDPHDYYLDDSREFERVLANEGW